MWKKIRSFLFENKTTKQTVAKNTVWLSISNFGGRILKAVIVIYGARLLGTAEYGVFSYAITLAGFFTLFVDPGINSIVMREGSRATGEERDKLFSTTLVLKIALILIGVLIVLFIAPIFSTLPGAKLLLPIVALIILFDSTREFLSSIIRSQEKMEWETGIFILANLGIVIFGFLFLRLAPTAASFGWAYVAGTAVGAITAIIVLRDQIRKVFSYFSAKLVPNILHAAWPFAVTGALGVLLTNTDILIISWMKNASDVGVYSAAIRIIQVLYLIPMILQYSMLPILSRYARDDNKKFRNAFEHLIGFVFLTSIPLAAGGFILGTQIMTFVFGAAFASGGLALKVLMITLLFDFPTVVVSTAVFSYNHQKSLIVTSAIGGILNVLFDILLIPRFGIVGSAVSTLFAQIISNWYLWHMMKKINYFEILPRLKKIIASGVTMALAATIFVALGMNLIINVLLSMIIYLLVLSALREPLLLDIKALFSPAADKASMLTKA